MRITTTFLVVSAFLCVSAVGAPSEKMVDAATLQAEYGVTVRSHPVSQGAMMFPTPRTQTIPDYPLEMRSHAVSGIVILRVAIGTDGTPRLKEVIRSSQTEFEHAAREAIRSWLFEPAQHDGRPTAVEVDYTFEFKINIDE
jgi:TonB family protein